MLFWKLGFVKKGYMLPKAQKTGTTIVGVVYKDSLEQMQEQLGWLLLARSIQIFTSYLLIFIDMVVG
jgi:hypothetical protein